MRFGLGSGGLKDGHRHFETNAICFPIDVIERHCYLKHTMNSFKHFCPQMLLNDMLCK